MDVAHIRLTLLSKADGKIPNGQAQWWLLFVVATLHTVLLCGAISEITDPWLNGC
jgi:hypothetical protein